MRSLAWRAAAGVGLPVGARRDAAAMASGAARLRRRYPDVWDRHLACSTALLQDRAFLWGQSGMPETTESIRASFAPQADLRGMDCATDFDLRCYLPGDVLVKVDRASMANSLETRAPLLDAELVQFVLGLPWKMRFGSGASRKMLKPLLREACDDLWPASLRDRPKQGFGAPVETWVRRPDVRELLQRVSGKDSALAALLPGAPALLGTTTKPDWQNAQQAWSLLCLGLWLEGHAECL